MYGTGTGGSYIRNRGSPEASVNSLLTRIRAQYNTERSYSGEIKEDIKRIKRSKLPAMAENALF